MNTQSKSPKTTPYNPVDDIKAFMDRFVVFNDEDHRDVLALWILHTHTFDAAYATPYMYVNSAEPQSGKTRTLEVASVLARKAINVAMLTPSTLFRLIEDQSPTMFIDEVDTVFSGAVNEDLRGVLNAGYKSGNMIPRTSGEEVKMYATFCPKMLVGIDNGQMPDTLKDRCIDINLKRKKTSQQVERFIPRKVEPEAEALKARIEQWASEKLETLLDAPDPTPIEGISDRAFEITEPLLMLATLMGKNYVKHMRTVFANLMGDKKPPLSEGIRTLMAANEIMNEAKTDKLRSSVLAAYMDMTPKKLGVVLAAYDIRPSTVRFPGGDKVKGYYSRDFQDAFERYL